MDRLTQIRRAFREWQKCKDRLVELRHKICDKSQSFDLRELDVAIADTQSWWEELVNLIQRD